MNIKAFLFDDDRGVSPVIGVILMVAITVILAAVIAAFVLGLGDTNSTAPSVTFDYEYDGSGSTDGNVTVTMTGGESFDPARVSFAGENLGQTNSTKSDAFDGVGSSGENVSVTELTWQEISSEGGEFGDPVDTVSAGDSVTLGLQNATSPNPNRGDIPSDFELRIIFTSEDGGTSSEIGGTSGPDA